MRLSSAVLKSNRNPPSERIPPFRSYLPLALKDQVSGRSQKQQQDAPCMYEMSVLLACMKENNFADQLCSNEVRKFQGCMNNYLTANQKQKTEQSKAEIQPGQKVITQVQMNNFLKKFIHR